MASGLKMRKLTGFVATLSGVKQVALGQDRECHIAIESRIARDTLRPCHTRGVSPG